MRWKYLPCVEILISGKISAFPPSDSKTWVQEEKNTVEQSKEGTQLGPGLKSHLFTYWAIASFIQEEIHSFSWASDSCPALLFLLQFWGMTVRSPSDLLIFTDPSQGYPNSPKKWWQGLNGCVIQCLSLPFSSGAQIVKVTEQKNYFPQQQWSSFLLNSDI